jgi:helicase MOV-10
VSLYIGDRILVQKVGATAGHWYEGGVHLVRKEEVGLRFHSSFGGWTKEQKYNVRFKLNRYPMRRQHQALDTVFSPDRILFPIESHIQRYEYPSPSIKVYNQLIATNPPQLKAIASILAQKPGAAPFAIFGP